jgi:hypothetical protein
MSSTFVWGLKRSGIHHVVNWLYANHGARTKTALATDGLHPQMTDGFCDPEAGVAFFNNCGQLYSRMQELGDLAPADFALAASRQPTSIFGIEDCKLTLAGRASVPGEQTTVLLLRDPLNHLASRLAAREKAPDLFKVDKPYIQLMSTYCAEALGLAGHLDPKVVILFNRFVADRSYRDTVAGALGVPNLDLVTEVSTYGGGSSFTGVAPLSSPASVLTRYRQRPVPPRLLGMLLEHDAIREACTSLFDYDLAEIASEP